MEGSSHKLGKNEEVSFSWLEPGAGWVESCHMFVLDDRNGYMEVNRSMEEGCLLQYRPTCANAYVAMYQEPYLSALAQAKF